MTRQMTSYITLVATVVLAAAVALVALFAPTGNARFTDAAATLAFITAAAVGIERAIEAGWTVVGGLAGSFWPLNAVGRQVDEMVEDLDQSLAPFHAGIAAKLDTVDAAGQRVFDAIDDRKKEIEQLNRRFKDLMKEPQDSQRVQLLVAAAARNVHYLRQKYEGQLGDLDLTQAQEVADTAIEGLQDFVASFQDNPGRRLISLYVGALLGLGLAGALGLDLFQAVLQPATDAAGTPIESSPLTDNPRLNVVLTGVVIGLGSSPTHEVIRAVQEYKKGRKGTNRSKPPLPPPPR